MRTFEKYYYNSERDIFQVFLLGYKNHGNLGYEKNGKKSTTHFWSRLLFYYAKIFTGISHLEMFTDTGV